MEIITDILFVHWITIFIWFLIIFIRFLVSFVFELQGMEIQTPLLFSSDRNLALIFLCPLVSTCILLAKIFVFIFE